MTPGTLNADGEYELFVPGRLCLFGEHSDWAAERGRHPGYCLIVGTNQGLSAVASTSDAFVVQTPIPDDKGRFSGQTRRIDCPWDAARLLAAAHDREEFFRHCAGVAHEMLQHPGVGDGIDLRITAMDLPLRKGVSSSAAVSILVARAFDAVHDLGMFPHELMDAAYRGEKLTGSQCGRMDQACVYGSTPVLLTFETSDRIRVEPVSPARQLDLFFVDLAGHKDTVKILADLHDAYDVSRPLRLALGEENERIARRAFRALSAGDAETLGALMTEAQEIFDRMVAPHSRKELTSPLLHAVLALGQIAPHVYGGKGVGSQGDGTAQFVARSPADRDAAMAAIESAFPQMQCFPLTIARGAAVAS